MAVWSMSVQSVGLNKALISRSQLKTHKRLSLFSITRQALWLLGHYRWAVLMVYSMGSLPSARSLDVVKIRRDVKLFVQDTVLKLELVLHPGLDGKHIICRQREEKRHQWQFLCTWLSKCIQFLLVPNLVIENSLLFPWLHSTAVKPSQDGLLSQSV